MYHSYVKTGAEDGRSGHREAGPRVPGKALFGSALVFLFSGVFALGGPGDVAAACGANLLTDISGAGSSVSGGCGSGGVATSTDTTFYRSAPNSRKIAL